ncbi:hypothetical protein ACHQM5_023227 [Ranunculus cassubicifolius]
MTGDSSDVVVESAAQVNSMDHQEKDELLAQSNANIPGDSEGKETAQNQSKTPSKTVRKEPDSQTDEVPAAKKMRPAELQSQTTLITVENPSFSRSTDDVLSKAAPPAPKSLFPCLQKDGMLVTEICEVRDGGISRVITDYIKIPEDQGQFEENKLDSGHSRPVIRSELPQQYNLERSEEARGESNCNSNKHVSPKERCRLLWVEGKCKNGDKCSFLHLSVIGDSLTMQLPANEKVVDGSAFRFESDKLYNGRKDESMKPPCPSLLF